MIKPEINVTPLIDVLLVLLIIFMVVSPVRPSRFETKVPMESPRPGLKDHPNALIVTLGRDLSLALNQENGLGNAADADALIKRLSDTFRRRAEEGIYNEAAARNGELSPDDKVERTVVVRAPTGVSYGNVAKVVDAIKMAGARPVVLQIDGLE